MCACIRRLETSRTVRAEAKTLIVFWTAQNEHTLPSGICRMFQACADHLAPDPGTLPIWHHGDWPKAECPERSGHAGKLNVTDNPSIIDRDQRNHTVAVRAQSIDQQRLKRPRKRLRDDLTNTRNVCRFFGAYYHDNKLSVPLLPQADATTLPSQQASGVVRKAKNLHRVMRYQQGYGPTTSSLSACPFALRWIIALIGWRRVCGLEGGATFNQPDGRLRLPPPGQLRSEVGVDSDRRRRSPRWIYRVAALSKSSIACTETGLLK